MNISYIPGRRYDRYYASEDKGKEDQAFIAYEPTDGTGGYNNAVNQWALNHQASG